MILLSNLTEFIHLLSHEQILIKIQPQIITQNTFIWGMAGENLDYGDMDLAKITELR